MRDWAYQIRCWARADAKFHVFAYLKRFHNSRMRRRVEPRERWFQALIKPSTEGGQSPSI